jgi:hypothetical protein
MHMPSSSIDQVKSPQILLQDPREDAILSYAYAVQGRFINMSLYQPEIIPQTW